jgi:hypothetical protein
MKTLYEDAVLASKGLVYKFKLRSLPKLFLEILLYLFIDE